MIHIILWLLPKIWYSLFRKKSWIQTHSCYLIMYLQKEA